MSENKNRQSYIALIGDFSKLEKGWDNGQGAVLQPLTRSFAETFFRKLPKENPALTLSMLHSGWLEVTLSNGDMQMLIFPGGYLIWNEKLRMFEHKELDDCIENFIDKC